MFAVPMTRELRPVPTLLGGSGRVRRCVVQRRVLPVLLRPPVTAASTAGA